MEISDLHLLQNPEWAISSDDLLDEDNNQMANG